MAALGTLGTLPKEERKAIRPARQRGEEGSRARVRGGVGAHPAGGTGEPLDAGAIDVTAPAGAGAAAAAPGHADAAAHLRDLRRDGVPDLPLARRGNRRTELRAAQHPGAPPGARHVGHVLHDDAQRDPAHAHVAGPDPRHARALPGADPRHPAGMCYRVRADHGAQRDPVLPGRGLAVRPPHHDGRSQGHADRFAHACSGRRCARASARITSRSPSPPPRWTWSASCATGGLPVCKQSGWLESSAAAWWHPVVLQNGGYDPREFSGFAFGMGRSASRC